MTTTLEEYDPLKASEKRIENSDNNTYSPAFPDRARREFRYSDRRLYKNNAWCAVSAVVGATRYFNFLGPSGVTLAAPEKSTTKPVVTYMRYPVSYRRRMRFFKNSAKAKGTPNLLTYTPSDATIYCGNLEQTTKYLEYARNKTSCVTAAKSTTESDDRDIARACCEANKWNWTTL